MSEKLSLAIENDALGGPSHDLRTIEQPPFEHCQRVRTKDGRVLDVSRCEKRVVHGKLRWVVDDLNGERAFADECELFEGKITEASAMNMTVGEAMAISLSLHEAVNLLSWFIGHANASLALDRNRSDESWYTGLKEKVEQADSLVKDVNAEYFKQPMQPEVRYACSKLAAVGDTVKVLGSNPPLHMKVEEISPTGGLYIKSPIGTACMLLNSSQVEFVPEANFPELPAQELPTQAAPGVEAVAPEVDYDTAPVLDVMRDALQRCYDAFADETLVNGPGNGKGKRYAIGVASAVALALNRARDELAKMPHVKFPAQTMGDGTQAGTSSVFARAWNGCLQTIRELNPDLQFEEACLDESRKFHLDLGLADRMQARAEKAEAKCEELEKRLNAEDVAHGNTIDHRDTHEASINAICAALSMEEYDASWTSHNNPPERAIEYIEALQSEAEQLAIAKLLLGQCDNRMFLVGKLELRRKQSGWSVFDPVANMFDGERYGDPIAAYQRAKALLEAFGKEAGAT